MFNLRLNHPTIALIWVLALANFISQVPLCNCSGSPNPATTDIKLNVHIVPHTHDDSGWLKTVDQYYWGARQDIQVAAVRYILDSVVEALAEYPERRFIYGEMSFFKMWWERQPQSVRDTVSQLVEQGRLEFINGGYVQHDEACAYYSSMIDQTTVGHRFLISTFGIVPRIGWQIDPFGHSSTHAGLLSSGFGYDALFFGRADYQEMEARKKQKALEMIWSGSASLPDADIFTGNFASGNYGPPNGFWFEWGPTPDPPMIDDPSMVDYNVEERVELFVQRCMELWNVTAGRDIMLTMGSDFTYANARVWFENLDKLIEHVNKDGRVNVFYSTPSKYVEAKHAYQAEWPVRGDDFFPYADFSHAYWTGYFTSRPTSKHYIRAAGAYLQAVRQLEAFTASTIKENKTQAHESLNMLDVAPASSQELELAVALTQHHDAITGTEKQHVANDYHRRLHSGLATAQQAVARILSQMITGPKEQQEVNQLDLQACSLLNVSACEISVQTSLSHATSNKGVGSALLVTLYNSLAWEREVPVRIPLAQEGGCSWTVTGPEGDDVAFQLVPISQATATLQQLLVSVNATTEAALGDMELVFMANLPPLGYSVYEISKESSNTRGSSSSLKNQEEEEQQQHTSSDDCSAVAGFKGHTFTQPQSQPPTATQLHRATMMMMMQQATSASNEEKIVTLSNGLIELQYDTRSGALIAATANGIPFDLTINIGYYNSSDGLDVEENREQASGAYIFRPNSYHPLPLTTSKGQGAAAAVPVIGLEIVQGSIVSEVRQVFDENWATLVTRLYTDKPYIEVEWTIGPIPFEDGLGKEVVIKYQSARLDDSEGQFWTDANGREMIERRRDFRPSWELNVTEPVAGNYYPMTSAAFLRGGKNSKKESGDSPMLEMAVLTDRAQGVASLRNGELEVMVHRRVLVDDKRGVNEPLNETMCGCIDCNCPGLVARGTHWLMLSSLDDSAQLRRSYAQQLNDPPLVMLTSMPTTETFDTSHPGGTSTTPFFLTPSSLQRQWSFSGGHSLPKNVHLLTLQDLASAAGSAGSAVDRQKERKSEHRDTTVVDQQGVLLRLAHLYEVGEDRELGESVQVDLGPILSKWAHVKLVEVSLSANQLKSDMQRLRFKRKQETVLDMKSEANSGSNVSTVKEEERKETSIQPADCLSDCTDGQILVTLGPMEIRTFQLQFSSEQTEAETTSVIESS